MDAYSIKFQGKARAKRTPFAFAPVRRRQAPRQPPRQPPAPVALSRDAEHSVPKPDARPNQRINDAKDWCPVTPPSLTISPTISPSSIAPSSAQRSSTKDAYKPDKRYSAPEHPRALVSPRSLSVANAARLPSPPRRNKADRPVEGQADNQRRQSASGSGYERRRRERTKEKAKQYRHKKKAERPRGEAQRYRPNYGPDTPVRTGGGKPRRGD